MRLVGLTGGIACGKSAVADFFRDLGARIIDLDQLAREVVEPGQPAWQEIVDFFGAEVLTPDRRVDRARLGEIVFNNETARLRLNAITHPRITEMLAARIQECEAQGAAAVVIEAALMIESGMQAMLNDLVVVYVEPEVQISRLMGRNQFSRDECLSRINSQMSPLAKVKYADYVVDNSGELATTRRQVETIWGKIQAQSRTA